MHIVILADPLENQNAGVHFYTKKLIESLLKLDKTNKYTFIHRRKNSFFDDKNHIILQEKHHPFYDTLRKFFLIPKLIKKLNPDLVLEPAHIGPFRIPSHIKRAVIIHDITPILFPGYHTLHSVLAHKILLKRILKNADLILTPSKNTANDIKRLYKTKENIEPIFAGTSLNEDLKPRTKKLNSPYILFLGTVEPRKNISVLIDAFLELKKEKKIPHKLIIGGKIGWKSKDIIEKTKHPEIIVTGYISEQEKTDLLHNAEIFVYPSIYEGFGIPPLEAMSLGTPTICSTGGSLKEIYENETLTFDPYDKEKLKQHILSLIKNPELKKSLIEKGHLLTKKYTWPLTAQKAIEAFEKTINKKH